MYAYESPARTEFFDPPNGDFIPRLCSDPKGIAWPPANAGALLAIPLIELHTADR